MSSRDYTSQEAKGREAALPCSARTAEIHSFLPGSGLRKSGCWSPKVGGDRGPSHQEVDPSPPRVSLQTALGLT